jgi:hypothetical protein
MKKILLIIVFFISSCNAFSQLKVDTNDLIGKWKVIQGAMEKELIPEELNEIADEMEQLSRGYKGLIFSFYENKDFEVDIPQSFPDKLKEMFIFIDNRKWKVDQKGIIQIGDSDVGYNLMGIIMIKKGKQTYFYLNETPFVLEVEKVKEF